MMNMNNAAEMTDEMINGTAIAGDAAVDTTADVAAEDDQKDNKEKKNKVKLIKNLHFGTLTLDQIADCNEDARPLGMIYGFLQKQKAILGAAKADERDKKNAQKYKVLFFLLDSDPKALRAWLMKGKALIDSGLVKTTDKDKFIMDQLLLVKKFYQQKYMAKAV